MKRFVETKGDNFLNGFDYSLGGVVAYQGWENVGVNINGKYYDIESGDYVKLESDGVYINGKLREGRNI